MIVQKINVNNFTVFKELEINFSSGINIFIGENGTGKTHLMKLIYCACRATNSNDFFSEKIVNTFRPDDYKIGNLVNKNFKEEKANVKVVALNENSPKKIDVTFDLKTKKWVDAKTRFDGEWEKSFNNIESIFIPAKEILSNSFNLISANARNNVEFDDTYIDIIHLAKVDISDTNSFSRKQIKKIEKIIQGKVFFDKNKDKFYVKKGNSKLEFNLVSEGIRKLALLWKLINNGVLKKSSVLFWDEPEANLNPIHIPFLVDVLLELMKMGVQIFISTHDYTLSKYFDIKCDNSEVISFHSLYKDEDNLILCETTSKFKNLEMNTIRDTFIRLYEDEINKVML